MNHLKKYFIPHKGNEYKPHFFRGRAIFLTASLIGFLFLFASSLSTIVITGSSQFGAVISSVLIDLTNADRTANNVGRLRVSPILEKVAQMKADDMAKLGYFAHTSPEGKNPWYWFEQAGYKYSFAGENLAVYFSDSAELEKAWMNSPKHRENILNSYFTEVGIAMAHGVYQGKETVYVVQVFGRPTGRVTASIVVPPKIVPKKSSVAPIAVVEKPIVKGETTEVPIKVLAEEDTFIAVWNMETSSTSLSQVNVSQVTTSPEKVTPIILKVATSPKTFLKTIYGWLSLFIGIALVLMVGIETKRQHFRHIFYGISLLVLMVIFLYIWQFLFFGKLLVR